MRRKSKPHSAMVEKNNVTVEKGFARYKLDEHGIIIRNKARLVAKGYNQEEGID